MRGSASQAKSAVAERRAQEKQARREAILAAAKRVYARKGFLAATIEEIATEARLGVGTIYLYYKSKEELYVSLLFESMAAFSSALTRILRSRRSPERKLLAVWDFFYRFHARSPESYRIFFLFQEKSFLSSVPPATLEKLNRAAGRNFALGAAIVEEGMKSGLFREGDPREIVDVLWCAFVGLVHLSEIRENLGLSISTMQELRRRTFELLQGGLKRGLASAGRSEGGERA